MSWRVANSPETLKAQICVSNICVDDPDAWLPGVGAC